METTAELATTLMKLPYESISGLIALGALALAGFTVYVVYSLTKDKK